MNLIIKNNFKKNIKPTLVTILNITLCTCLIICVCFIVLGIRELIVEKNLKENNYHVKIETPNIKKLTNYENIKRVEYSNENILITYIDKEHIKQNTKQLCKQIKCTKITYNQSVIDLYTYNLSNPIIKTILFIISALFFAIFIIIKATFKSSLLERQREYAVLKSLGMTSTQMHKMLIKETLIILGLSLILGIILGTIISYLIFQIINHLLKEINIELILCIDYHIIIIAIIYIAILTIISAIYPIHKISKAKTIELIKNSTNIKRTNLKQELTKISLARYNYKRDKKRYKPIILCTIISIYLYTAFSLTINYTTQIINKYSNLPEYDGIITINGNNLESLKKFANQNHLKTYSLFRTCTTQIEPKKSEFIKYYTKTKNLIIISSNQNKIINKVKEIKENKEIYSGKYLKTFKLNNQNIPLSEKVPWGLSTFLTKENIVFLTTNFDNYCKNQNYNTTLIYKGNINLKEKVKNLNQANYIDIRKTTKIINNTILSIKIMLYSLIFIITTITIISFINIARTNIKQRHKELGILISLGLEENGLKQLLLEEYKQIIKKAIIIAVILTYAFDYLLYSLLNEILDITFIHPIKEIIIATAITIITINIITTYLTNKINSQNISRLIR